MQKQLIPTFTGTLAGETQQLVNARDLHALLGVGKDFSTWIKDRIETYGFIEGEDYSPSLGSGKNQGLSRFMPGHNRKDYRLSFDMGKEISMLENNYQGRKARRYFIQMEKVARQEIPAFLRRAPARGMVEALQAVALQKPSWAALKRYYELKLTQGEMGRLMGWRESTVRQALRDMAACGLVDYRTNPLLSAAGKKGLAASKLRHLAIVKGGAA